jgi:hypothetical protein
MTLYSANKKKGNPNKLTLIWVKANKLGNDLI